MKRQWFKDTALADGVMWNENHLITYINALENRIKELEADRPQGEWIDWLGKGNEWECSVCRCSIESHGSIAYNFCPMCGARMIERKEKE